jgi:hypothetical protein
MADRETNVPMPTAVPSDTGLRCPRCEYNLTGLVEARCPECGTTFDWEDVRRGGPKYPTIAFERSRGWRKVPAFVVTWATILFAPWVFARQAVTRASGWHALVFGVFCFVPVTARYLWEWQDGEIWLVWVGTAVVYILLQAMVLTTLDWSGWRHPLASLRFWVIIGGYTSAIIATEWVIGPPLLEFADLRSWVVRLLTPPLTLPPLYGKIFAWPGFGSSIDAHFGWITLCLWLAGLACVYARRLRRSGVSSLIVWLAIPFAMVGLLMLYAFCMEWIGGNILFRLVDHMVH